MLASFYGDDTAFSVTSFAMPGVEHAFTSFSAAIAEVSDARVWGGIHFRFACVDAVRMGASIADYVERTQLLREHGRTTTMTISQSPA